MLNHHLFTMRQYYDVALWAVERSTNVRFWCCDPMGKMSPQESRRAWTADRVKENRDLLGKLSFPCGHLEGSVSLGAVPFVATWQQCPQEYQSLPEPKVLLAFTVWLEQRFEGGSFGHRSPKFKRHPDLSDSLNQWWKYSEKEAACLRGSEGRYGARLPMLGRGPLFLAMWTQESSLTEVTMASSERWGWY